MTGSQRLDIRQGQNLVMTPQLQQAIKLLQMSSMELSAFVAGELENNPFLEREDGFENFESNASSPSSHESLDPAQASSPTESQTPDGYDSGSESFASHDTPHTPGAEKRPLAETLADKPSLRDHLISQIHIDFVNPIECLIAVALVDLIDEAGYLPHDLDLVRAQLGVTPALFDSVIERLQRCDPPGIFARSLKECLTIQLREKNRLDPAMVSLLDHLDLLAKRELQSLMKLCGVDQEDLADMINEIRALDPKPALAFTADAAPTITPDVFLIPQPKEGWRVELNSDNLPRVLVNETFYTQINNGTLSGEDKSYMSERWQHANWLVKALHQRATTILKVASEIVRQQDKFFVYGVQHLKPLILKDIAEAIEIHESTVSRVTQNKYIATPRGLFELKYFFSGALPTTGGVESVSTHAVRERIKALVDAENPKAILSDDKIMELLRKEGIDIARRTVAKYRESLNIPSSAQRRRDKRVL
ncbi:MAG: RNA polymerase sigma-54 factor [Proteobacteria bacterium]|nr:RNA polymerase factor sigma-54 [Alphaproteobacteria bacterium]NCC03412.1 RNA polymerase sigma-54 factor [Pseudomonadota bacterium]